MGFALKTFEETPLLLLIGRFLCGLGGGGAMSLPPLYVGEICEPRVRGFLSSLMMVEFSLGLFTVYLLGDILDIHMLPQTLLSIPLTFLLAFWFMPETPLYRLRLGQEEVLFYIEIFLDKPNAMITGSG
jgi:MFS family permease